MIVTNQGIRIPAQKKPEQLSYNLVPELSMRLAVGLLLFVILLIGTCSAQHTPTNEKTASTQAPEPYMICSPKSPQEGCTYPCNDPDRPTDKRCIQRPRSIFTPDPEYSDRARKGNVQGTVLLEIVVDEVGQVTSANILRGLEPGLDQNSLDTVKRWKFEPAKVDDKAVPIRLQVTMSFRMYSWPRRSPPPVIRKP